MIYSYTGSVLKVKTNEMPWKQLRPRYLWRYIWIKLDQPGWCSDDLVCFCFRSLCLICLNHDYVSKMNDEPTSCLIFGSLFSLFLCVSRSQNWTLLGDILNESVICNEYSTEVHILWVTPTQLWGLQGKQNIIIFKSENTNWNHIHRLSACASLL